MKSFFYKLVLVIISIIVVYKSLKGKMGIELHALSISTEGKK